MINSGGLWKQQPHSQGEEQPEAPETPDDGETPETPENPNGGENQETPENPNGGETPQQPENPENPDGEETPQTPQQPENPEEPEAPEEESTAYSRLYWDTSLTDPIPPNAEDNVIVETAKPYKQEGAVLYFLVKKDVWVQGAFLNHIAGFRGGEEKEEAPLTCVLEQRTEDKKMELYWRRLPFTVKKLKNNLIRLPGIVQN